MRNPAQVVIEKLREQGAYLATVESCTGGLVASRITDLAGSSDIFWGSYVTYANSAKEQLGVPEALLRKHGAVSPEVARAMAESGLRKMAETLPGKALYCVATSGIAGPGGATPGKPVGLCHLALARSGKPTIHLEIRSPDIPVDMELRLANKSYFAHEAIELVLKNA